MNYTFKYIFLKRLSVRVWGAELARCAPRSITCVEQWAALRATVWATLSSTCDSQRATQNGHQPEHHDQVPATINERHRGQRNMACTPRSSTCASPRASSWAPRSSSCAVPCALLRAAAWAPQTSTSWTKTRARATTGPRPTKQRSGTNYA
jgi:hypothetical protein